MLNPSCLNELRTRWLPNTTDEGLRRLINLLQADSPLLVHGCFTKAVPMGCLATHIAWNHPITANLTQDAGVTWLCRVARLNPATSRVIQAWDSLGSHSWDLRMDLLAELRSELTKRAFAKESASTQRLEEMVPT